jgi:signal transduction histidine kinase/HAMP domain-containing protein
MASNLTDQVRSIAEVTTAVANGDLSGKITVEARGEVAALADTLNTMVDRLRSFAGEVTRVAREVGTEGKLGGQAEVEGVSGTWRDLTESVNGMASNLTDQVRQIAQVTTAVADGDLSQKVTSRPAARSRRSPTRSTGWSTSCRPSPTRSPASPARSVRGRPRRPGRRQGRQRHVARPDRVGERHGVEPDRPGPPDRQVTTAVANGDLSQKVTVEARGEVAALADTINRMVDQLSSFAAEVTRVAREVGTEGALGRPGRGGRRVRHLARPDRVGQPARRQPDHPGARDQGRVRRRDPGRPDPSGHGRGLRRGRRAQGHRQPDDREPPRHDPAQRGAGLAELEPRAHLRPHAGPARPQPGLAPDHVRGHAARSAPSTARSSSPRATATARAPDDAELRLIASYGYKQRKSLSNRFKVGEALVGQAALEAKAITITQAPEDYIKVTSGLGEASPRNIVVLPVLFEEEVMAVIELATLGEFSDVDTTFLEQLSETLGVVLNAIIANQRTEQLLEQSQELTRELQERSEELTSQQEELRRSNAELEQQAQSLKASEELLQTQQEELRQTNEELQEKAALLSQQNRDIELQNREIELARQSLEEQANELALTSKYKSEFLANMSHELRTPLNSLLILSKLLSDNPDRNLTDKQIEFARTIHQAGSDLLALISDILDLSKVEAGKMDIHPAPLPLTDVRDYVDRAFRLGGRGEGADVRLELDEDAPVAHHRRAAPAAGAAQPPVQRVQVHRGGRGQAAHRPGRGPLRGCASTVSDTGIGIPKGQAAADLRGLPAGPTAARAGATAARASACRSRARSPRCSAASSRSRRRRARAARSRCRCRAEIVAPIIDPDEDDDLPLPRPALSADAAPAASTPPMVMLPDGQRTGDERRARAGGARRAGRPRGHRRGRPRAPRRGPRAEAIEGLAEMARTSASRSSRRRPARRPWAWPTSTGPTPCCSTSTRRTGCSSASSTSPAPATCRSSRSARPTSARARCAAAPRSSSSGRRRRPADQLPGALTELVAFLERPMRHVLVVEDDEAERKAVCELVSGEGIEVTTAARPTRRSRSSRAAASTASCSTSSSARRAARPPGSRCSRSSRATSATARRR